MPIQPTLTRGSLGEAALLRQQASELLARLVEDRESSEQRLAALGRRDPIKIVTGVTALERAILATRDMIADMDLMLAELDSGLHAEPAVATQFNGALPSRTSTAPARLRPSGMLSGLRPVAAAV